jgi:hypothetical protein
VEFLLGKNGTFADDQAEVSMLYPCSPSHYTNILDFSLLQW